MNSSSASYFGDLKINSFKDECDKLLKRYNLSKYSESRYENNIYRNENTKEIELTNYDSLEKDSFNEKNVFNFYFGLYCSDKNYKITWFAVTISFC